jgi:5-methylcytosine-specific restriction endonuclease McrA
MAQTKEGAIKCAAKKADISVDEYLERTGAGLKKCTICKQWKSIQFFAKDLSRFDGLKSKCRTCDYKPKTNRVGVRERRLMLQKGLRWCRKCRKWLKSEFVVKNGLCKPHEAEDARIRYVTSEKYRRERRQHTYSRKRDCQPITPETQMNVLKEFDGKCAYCGDNSTTFDHIIPITKGGHSEIQNIVPACASCNPSKRNKNVFEWIEAKSLIVSDKLKQRLEALFKS